MRPILVRHHRHEEHSVDILCSQPLRYFGLYSFGRGSIGEGADDMKDEEREALEWFTTTVIAFLQAPQSELIVARKFQPTTARCGHRKVSTLQPQMV